MLYVIDNFLNDSLYEEVKNDTSFFPVEMDGEDIGETNNWYHDGASSCFAPYMFWKGWMHEPVDTVRKKVIQAIWENNNFIPFPLEEIAGFEYWCRTFSPGQYLNIHVDEDTFAYEKDNDFNAPALGCVWYGATEAGDGGYLELHEGRIEGNPEDALEKENIERLTSPCDMLERIAYKPNRLVVFEAGRRLHNTTKASWGKRQVMVVNVWHISSPPSGVRESKFFHE
jgi:hypothetical protein